MKCPFPVSQSFDYTCFVHCHGPRHDKLAPRLLDIFLLVTIVPRKDMFAPLFVNNLITWAIITFFEQ